jgi:hypothetical protein
MAVLTQTTNKPLPMLDKPYWQECLDIPEALSTKEPLVVFIQKQQIY